MSRIYQSHFFAQPGQIPQNQVQSRIVFQQPNQNPPLQQGYVLQAPRQVNVPLNNREGLNIIESQENDSPKRGAQGSGQKSMYGSQISPSRHQDHYQSQFESEVMGTQKEEMYKKKRIANIFILICPLLLALIFLITSIVLISKHYTSKKDLKNADDVIGFLYQNLLQAPITGINTGMKDCPGNTHQVQLGDWSGIERGCMCQDGQTHDYSFCLSNWKQCSLVSYRGPVITENWNNNAKICVSRNNKWQAQISCNSVEQKQCYENICVANDELCGENKILIKPNGKQLVIDSIKALFAQQKYSHSSNFQIDEFLFRSEYNFDLSRSNSPIVQIIASTGQSPCLNPRLSPSTESGKSYPLQKQKFAGCDEYGDLEAYSIPLSSMNLSQFYEINGLNQIFDGIPEYNNYINNQDTIYLVAVKRVKVEPSEKCQEIEYGDFDMVKEFSGFGRGVLLFVTWILLLSCLLTILFAVLYALRATNTIPVQFEEQKTINVQAYYYSSFVIILLALFDGIIYHFAFANNVEDIVDRFRGYIQNRCFTDNGIIKALQRVIEYNQETGDIYYGAVHFMVIFSFLYIIFWGAIWYAWKHKIAQQYLNGMQPKLSNSGNQIFQQ